MLVVGLTGSIAMGKSATARMFARLGCPVFCADEVVHKLYAKGGAAVPLVGREFPTAVTNGMVDRERLAAVVTGDRAKLARLEAIVHPLVKAEERRFLAAAEKSGSRLAVLDIPLLFETGRDQNVDAVVVVSAPKDVQRSRALARQGMTAEKFEAILARQVPDSEKRRRADFVVDSSAGLERAFEQVRAIVDALSVRAADDSRDCPRHRDDRP